MRQYTTPFERLFVKGVTLSNTDRVFVTYSGKKATFPVGINPSWDMTITIDDPVVTPDQNGEGTWVVVHLTQEQTGSFAVCETVGVQVNWLTEEGERGATKVCYIPVTENLLKEVIV